MMLMLSNTVFAQTFTITPDDSASSSGYREDMQSLFIYQHNTSPDTISIKWKKVSASVPALWDATICDNLLCYTGLQDSGVMNRIAPDTAAYLLLHVTSHVNYGTAIVRYAVWDVANPAMKDTLTFLVTANDVSAINEAGSDQNFRIYPNPVQGTLQIQTSIGSDFTYTIKDLSGREILTDSFTGGSCSVPAGNIASGIYCLSISDKDKNTYTKKIIKE
ncbi:MAG: hypothetical protein JWO03_2967 [Bacteroidetes bacterium]|nr:hypothetical protein [Bacteroidota bacterium]